MNALSQICMLCFHFDAKLEVLKEQLEDLYDPTIKVVHVRASENLETSTYTQMLDEVRSIFPDAEVDTKIVSEFQVFLLGYFWGYTERELRKGDKNGKQRNTK